MTTRRQVLLIGLSGFIPLSPVAAQGAMPIVLCLGASNTAGRGRGRTNGGVDRPKAFPAKLQQLLSQQGVRASVQNAGIAGDTTGGMLRRLPSLLKPNTKVVVLQPGGNDARRGEEGDKEANIAQIRAILDAKGIRMIRFDRLGAAAGSENRVEDGQHYNEQGHIRMAQYLLSDVVSALSR